MSGIIFVDCETTGLDPRNDEIWELALIEEDGTEHAWFLAVDLRFARREALEVGRFFERFPFQDPEAFVQGYVALSKTATLVANLTADKQLVSINPAFDAAFLKDFLSIGLKDPMWHYHVIDVKALAAGWLRGRFSDLPPMKPPWSTADLARALHLSPEDFDRHTALGDARLAKAMYEAVMAS